MNSDPLKTKVTQIFSLDPYCSICSGTNIKVILIPGECGLWCNVERIEISLDNTSLLEYIISRIQMLKHSYPRRMWFNQNAYCISMIHMLKHALIQSIRTNSERSELWCHAERIEIGQNTTLENQTKFDPKCKRLCFRYIIL